MSDHRCLVCGSSDLQAEVTLVAYYPLTARHGSIKVGNRVINQIEVKHAWDGEERATKARKGPIICIQCETRHVYITATGALELEKPASHR